MLGAHLQRDFNMLSLTFMKVDNEVVKTVKCWARGGVELLYWQLKVAVILELQINRQKLRRIVNTRKLEVSY
jgi:hypothetical protein